MTGTGEKADPFDEYRVVVNDEEQYSLWPTARDLPDGWHEEGFRGSRQSCLDHVERVWTDMRPRSLRVATESSVPGAGTHP